MEIRSSACRSWPRRRLPRSTASAEVQGPAGPAGRSSGSACARFMLALCPPGGAVSVVCHVLMSPPSRRSAPVAPRAGPGIPPRVVPAAPAPVGPAADVASGRERRGVESEMEFAFAGLHQVCGPMLGRLGQLPGPQGEALAVAFGMREGQAPYRFLVGVAVLGLLAVTAEDQPLACLVDDVQWLDRVS